MNSIKNYNRDFRETVHSTRNVIVKSGSLPIVITALHGGLDRPSSIPDRKQEGSLLLADMHTKEIAEAVGRGIHDHFKYAAPHVVLSKVSRRKVDLNRSLKEGTESANGAKVWQEYHGYVQEAINSVLKDHPHGILFDFHGHTHPNGMIELGYLLETSDLESSADQLNQLVLQTSSIQSLARRLVVDHQPDELLKYFGNAIVNQSSGQFAVTPSSSHPVPDGGMKYFSGGYTTQHYHSYKDSLDVIQIELPKELRLDEKNRAHTIQVLIKAIVQFLDEHYLKKSKL